MNDHNHSNNVNNYNHGNKNGDSRAMWGMMILCLLPIILLFFGTKPGPPYSWIIFILAIVFMFGHHLNFFSQKGHNHSNGNDPKENSKQSAVSGSQNPE